MSLHKCGSGLMAAVVVLLFSFQLTAQTLSPAPPDYAPSPLAVTPTAQQQQALQQLTSAQQQTIQSAVNPRIQSAMAAHTSTANEYRPYADIIGNGSNSAQAASVSLSQSGSPTTKRRSASITFVNQNMGQRTKVQAVLRQYHPVRSAASSRPTASSASPALRPIQPNPDQDGDGLPDCCDGLETSLAYEFRPEYYISNGEQQQFASYADSVPWTVTALNGTNPPTSYVHVSPLGLAQDSAGNQLFAIRVDFLSLWNADGGLVGGGAACFYSYFGLDSVINQISGHQLDAERSVMLLAAPAVNGSYNPDASQYSLYSIYTAAHEGTFFDQSSYADFATPIAPNNHVLLAQSVSKHSTYGFNPDYYPITPAWFIDSVNFSITAAYADGDIDDFTYYALLAAADDTFFGCLVERFGDQGPASLSYPVFNVGEVNHPLPGYSFIQDDSNQALHLADKLILAVF